MKIVKIRMTWNKGQKQHTQEITLQPPDEIENLKANIRANKNQEKRTLATIFILSSEPVQNFSDIKYYLESSEGLSQDEIKDLHKFLDDLNSW